MKNISKPFLLSFIALMLSIIGVGIFNLHIIFLIFTLGLFVLVEIQEWIENKWK